MADVDQPQPRSRGVCDRARRHGSRLRFERVEPRTDGFIREWFTSSEQDAIARTDAEERPHMVTLLWSAKESALKAMGTGLTIATHDVMVTVDEPGPDGEWNSLARDPTGQP